MGLSTASKLGKELAASKQTESSLSDNISPDDPSEQIIIGAGGSVVVSGTIHVIGKEYDEDSLVFNHPIQGDLNVFVWNGGYSGDEVILYDTRDPEPASPSPSFSIFS